MASLSPDPQGSERLPRRFQPWMLQGTVALGLLGIGIVGYAFFSRAPARPAPTASPPPPVRTRAVELAAAELDWGADAVENVKALVPTPTAPD